jgi:hypothetical protein
LNEDTYDVKCCNGALMNQGIGNIDKTPLGAFSDGYSSGFNVNSPL